MAQDIYVDPTKYLAYIANVTHQNSGVQYYLGNMNKGISFTFLSNTKISVSSITSCSTGLIIGWC